MEHQELQSTAPAMDSGNEAADLHHPALQAVEKPPRRTLVLPIPLENKFIAQLLIPADMGRGEMLRLRRVLWTLAVPWRNEDA